MSSVPLKLKDSAAPTELQQMSTTEENYLAYQVGLGFAALDSSSVNQLGVNLTGSNRTVGTFTDTSYDSAIGTHSNLLSLTQTDTIVRQKTGTIGVSNTDYRVPISMRDSGGQSIIDEMNDTKLNPLLDRVASRIYTSDYPGTYKLATSAPSGDYSVNLANVMTDTRSDGHSLTYNIYKRNTMTAPTTVRPFAIKRSSGRTGTYQGLQAMTDAQIKYTLGLNIRNRISATANSVGSYKLLSSATGTPTNAGFAGTWQAKGTATDTRQDLTLADYTRSRSSTYSRTRSSAFTADYTRTRASTYLRSSTTSRSSTYSATYTKTRTSNYSPAFVGDYIGNFTTTTGATFSRTRGSTLTYLGNYTGDFTGNYGNTLSYLGEYTNNFIGNYLGQDFLSSYSRTLYVSVDQETFYFTGNFATAYAGTYTGNFTRTSTVGVSYQRNSTNTFTGNYTRLASYVGNYSNTFTTESTRNSQRITANTYVRQRIDTYTGDFTRDRQTNFARNFTGNYTGDFTGNFTGDYTRNFTGNYTRNFTRAYSRTVFTRSFSTYQTGKGIWQYSSASYVGAPQYYSRNFSRNFMRYRALGTYVGDFTGNYVGGGSSSGPFGSGTISSNNGYYWKITEFYAAGDYEAYLQIKWNGSIVYQSGNDPSIPGVTTITVNGVTYTRGSEYDSNFAIAMHQVSATGQPVDYTRTSTRNSTRTESYQRTRATAFSQTFAGAYARNYTGNFVGNYARDFQRTVQESFTGASSFTRDFAGNFVGDYARNFTAQFTGDYARNFAGNYAGNYSRNYLGNYARTFAGNYTGTTIGASPVNIETYTLYVRVV